MIIWFLTRVLPFLCSRLSSFLLSRLSWMFFWQAYNYSPERKEPRLSVQLLYYLFFFFLATFFLAAFFVFMPLFPQAILFFPPFAYIRGEALIRLT